MSERGSWFPMEAIQPTRLSSLKWTSPVAQSFISGEFSCRWPLLAAASWSVFWVDEEAAPAKFGTAVTVLVSMVAFSYSVDFSLPKVPYLTFADTFSLTVFAYMLAVIFAVTAIHFVHTQHSRDRAERLQRFARRGFPASFVVIIALQALYSLG